MPLAEPGGGEGPAFSPIPREQQGFMLAPAFPPAVAGMWWPQEQCRHLAPVPSVTVLGAAARAQPCSQGAGRKQMEMTPAAVSCGRTRWLSPPLFQLPSQRDPRDPASTGIAAQASKSPVRHAGTGPLLRSLSQALLCADSPGCTIPGAACARPLCRTAKRRWAAHCLRVRSLQAAAWEQELNQHKPEEGKPLLLSSGSARHAARVVVMMGEAEEELGCIWKAPVP